MSNFSKNPADSGYFDFSHSLSGENTSFQNETPSNRKRKASCIEFENLEKSPPFSSTLNESFMNNFDEVLKKGLDSPAQRTSKSHRTNEQKKFYSVPNTPDQQIKYGRDTLAKSNTNSFVKNFSQFGMQSQSPLHKEAYEILYPELPPLECKKSTTPLKIDKSNLQAKKRLFYKPQQNLLNKIISNHVIMNKILKDLSNGDLYRLAKVSKAFKEAILRDIDASIRFAVSTDYYKGYKENYRITPPTSPEQIEYDTEAQTSPRAKRFQEFYNTGKSLYKNQSLMKCVKCQELSVVEHDIAQCQNIRCGYIVCRRCDSFSFDPRQFKDTCQHAQLLNSSRPRNLLGDVSNNCTGTSDYMTDISNSIFSSSFSLNISKLDSSGTFSDFEVSTPKQKVKRNLSKAFVPRSEVKIFASSNSCIDMPQPKKFVRRTSLIPVVPLEATKIKPDTVDLPSPPRNQQYSVCSRQSKRNLKRLTR
ncbi:uncharacterized protein LOC126883985 [Diabrotica virgifera virgifera]|uniref:F-box domain-containing protein n=1 Tax=Diabrotica virgifera virgifera TaxID=50390 RepID=A0ABM5K6A7_DIAVI|nr:uncharacterized protein LOC126883985 [Diabrotica virgifera virgifera]